jgi:hypothetical protein
MTKQIFTILLFLLTASTTNVYAGWYACYNYKGTIDKYPITLSIQVNEGYFGEKAKKDFNIIGVYKYDKQNSPIRLEGKMNEKDNTVMLYEIHQNQQTAVLEFVFSEQECTGTWKAVSDKNALALHLHFVSKLIDTVPENQAENIEILQMNALKDFYFTGIYSKKEGQDKAQMDYLQIIRKKDNVLFQTIDFSAIETTTGNVSTIIYENVEITDLKTKSVTVWNNIGKMGGYLTIRFNAKTQKFKLNPKPFIEG